MSKIGCKCGHVIRDQTDGIPYKASILRDVDYDKYWDFVGSEIQSYIEAMTAGNKDEWLLARGLSRFGSSRSHGDILRKQLISHYFSLSKDAYECESCGRLHIESSRDRFLMYTPDSGRVNGIFSINKDDEGDVAP